MTTTHDAQPGPPAAPAPTSHPTGQPASQPASQPTSQPTAARPERPTRAEVEYLLYREARLLDTVQLEEWLTLFTDDGLYWLPLEDGDDPAAAVRAVSIVYDDRSRREERVYRTLHTPVLDQNPRSRTVHLVGNVEVLDTDERGDVRVLCNQVIGEIRSGGPRQVGLNTTRWFGARCEFRLRASRDGWRISLKKTVLIDSDQPLYNLTFMM